MKTSLRELAGKCNSLHRKLASRKEARNWQNFAILAIFCSFLGVFAQPGQPTQEKTATLLAPTQFPITVDGKQIGSGTLPPKTEVSVIQENSHSRRGLDGIHPTSQ